MVIDNPSGVGFGQGRAIAKSVHASRGVDLKRGKMTKDSRVLDDREIRLESSHQTNK